MNKYKHIDIFNYCKSLTDCFVVNEWEVHENFDQIKPRLTPDSSICMIVEATDAVHPYHDQYTENLNYLINFFKNSPQSRLIYYSVNLYTEFDNIQNITYRWIPEYHAYYYPIYQNVKINTFPVTKKFLCLNKRVDEVRWMLYKKFYTDDLLDQSLFSFLGQDNYGVQENIDSVANAEKLFQVATAYPEIARLKTPPELFRKLPDDQLFTKNTDGQPLDIDPSWVGNDHFYHSTFCSIISETSASSNRPNFSEKIFRSIMYGHPFVLIGAPHSLSMLRDLGFDTYDDIFDTSYDTVLVRDHRIIKVFEVIDQISQLSLDDLNRLNSQLLPRRLHNIKNYQIMHNKLLDKSSSLIQELQYLLS